MAFLMGVSQPQISRWENGEREPGIYNAIGLAVAMRRAAEDIFFDYRKEWQEKIREREKMLKSNEMVENNII
jgi:transcriptional regulator with XRE-family HTH domain